jgi:16S rRNA (cytidine1402-2'-O)-methyltransferase
VAGTLILCAGPIGNLGDAPGRLAEVLASADTVYAEDTRRARVLLSHLGVDRRLRSFFIGNEAERAVEMAGRLEAGETVALLTDAGTPGIADPGLTAVRAALEAGAVVTGVPGPSAVTLALSLAGLPSERFVFEGFLPRRGGHRRRRLEALRVEPRTIVMFCAPGRLTGDLADLLGTLDGDREVVVCRELTKLHEEIWRGSLAEAAGHWGLIAVRGEVTLVLAGAGEGETDVAAALERAESLTAEGVSPSRACRMVAEETGASRRLLYEALIRRRNENAGASGSD